MALEGVSALPREGGLEALEGGRGLCSAQTRRAERGGVPPPNSQYGMCELAAR